MSAFGVGAMYLFSYNLIAGLRLRPLATSKIKRSITYDLWGHYMHHPL